MNQNIAFFLLCPVPDDQKPINEYIGLKENLLTSWTTLSTEKYQKKLFSVAGILFLLISLFQLSSFQGFYYLFEWILGNCFITTSLLFLLFLIILSRWLQTYNRFKMARLFYEEASWYDGQIWEKPLSLIKNDNLINSQKIRPIIKRIEKTLLQLFCLNCLFFLFLAI
jgi:hypothetical protein